MDHLCAHVIGNVTDVETIRVLHRDGAVHEHLQEQVAQLLTKRRRVTALDRLEHLVGFLEQVRTEAAVGLFSVPRAPTGCSKLLDHFVERAQRRNGFLTHGHSTVRPRARAYGPVRGGRAREGWE